MTARVGSRTKRQRTMETMHMRHALHVLAIVLLWPSCPRPAAAVTETYLFRDSFAPEEGAGNVLVPVSNATGTIVSSGPDFINGSFVTESISAAACASTPSVRAWSFLDKSGLYYPNATPTVVTGSYTISMLMRYDPMNSGYARLIDFSNSTLDTGIYKFGNGVSFYPVGTFAAGSFVQGQDVFVTITRDAGTQLVSLYINGVPSGTYTDTGNLYAPSATVVYFLMDNTTGSFSISETNPGTIAYLQIRDTPITTEEVAASLATICQVVSATTTTTLPPTTTTHPPTTTTTLPPTTTTTHPPTTTTTLPATTTTTHPSTTTTTLPPQGCAGTPQGATFASILCRLDALAARVQGESGLASFQSKLANSLGTARSRIEDAQSLCDAGANSAKKTKKNLQEAGKAVSQYVHRLAGLRARKKLDGTLRTDLMQAGQAIAPDLNSLRAHVQCPPA
jgi:hypothetical protein